MKNPRGVFFHDGAYWIQYYEAAGRRRREKVGTKGNAIKLVEKRRTERLEGKKFPENLRKKPILFSDIAADALVYSEAHKRRPYDDRIQMRRLVEVFGARPAESLTPTELERWLGSHEQWSPATRNRWRALLSLTYRLAMQNGKASSNPARLVKRMREDNGRIRFLNQSVPDEESHLRAVIADRYPQHLPDYLIALNCGCDRLSSSALRGRTST